MVTSELREKAVKFAAANTKKYVTGKNPDIILVNLASNALAHGYYQGSEQRAGLEIEEHSRPKLIRWVRDRLGVDSKKKALLAATYTAYYIGKHPGARGVELDTLRGAYLEGFRAGLYKA